MGAASCRRTAGVDAGGEVGVGALLQYVLARADAEGHVARLDARQIAPAHDVQHDLLAAGVAHRHG